MHRRWIALLAACAAAASLTGCGQSAKSSVSVQSVAMLCGIETVIQSQQFAGIVSTGREQNVARDSDKKVSVVYVKEGDQVREGDKLFSYDSEQAQNSLERAKLELEEMQNAKASKENEKAQLEKDKTKAAQSEQMDYTLKIQEVETDLRENDYNMAMKEREIQRMEDSLKNLDVTAPLTGRVEKAGTADAPGSTTGSSFGGDDGGEEYTAYDDSNGEESDASAFIKIVENENFRIKGTINEQNITDITTGMDMVIYSRVRDDVTWRGTVTEIDMKKPESSDDSMNYYGGGNDEMTTTSKYPFYVSIDSLDGLMIGQHVYMRADNGELGADEIRLDSSFVNDADQNPWIWAEGKDGLLEKRAVKAEDYDEGDNTYLITEGLDAEDYIAPSSDAYEEGMPCIQNNNTTYDASADHTAAEGDEDDEDYGDEDFDEGYDDGEYFGGEDFDDEEYYMEDEEFDFEDDFEEEAVGGGGAPFAGGGFAGGPVG